MLGWGRLVDIEHDKVKGRVSTLWAMRPPRRLFFKSWCLFLLAKGLLSGPYLPSRHQGLHQADRPSAPRCGEGRRIKHHTNAQTILRFAGLLGIFCAGRVLSFLGCRGSEGEIRVGRPYQCRQYDVHLPRKHVGSGFRRPVDVFVLVDPLFGFGSTRAPQESQPTVLRAAQRLGPC